MTPQFAGDFASALEDFIGKVSDNVITDEGRYQDTVRRFDEILRGKSDSVKGWAVYRCFVKNFGLLSKAPYGFLLTVKDEQNKKTHHPEWGRWENDGSTGLKSRNTGKTDAFLTGTSISAETGVLAKDSYRVYPIVVWGLEEAEGPGIALALYVPSSYSDSFSWCAIAPLGKLVAGSKPQHTWTFKEHTGSSGSRGEFGAVTGKDQTPLSVFKTWQGFFEFNDSTPASDTLVPVTLTPLDFQDVHGYTMHGIPMWYQPCFNLIKKTFGAGL